MFAKLRGVLDSVNEDSLIIDVGGVGYLVHAASRTLSQLPEAGEPLTLFIETQVREDAIALYGFLKAEEQRWFRLLHSVQGVGARIALAILSVLSAAELTAAIAAQDTASVARANGVGPKLAQRIVLELKDKAGALSADFGTSASAPVASVPAVQADAISALVNLGYRLADATAAVSAALAKLDGGARLDVVVRAALKEAAQR